MDPKKLGFKKFLIITVLVSVAILLLGAFFIFRLSRRQVNTINLSKDTNYKVLSGSQFKTLINQASVDFPSPKVVKKGDLPIITGVNIQHSGDEVDYGNTTGDGDAAVPPSEPDVPSPDESSQADQSTRWCKETDDGKDYETRGMLNSSSGAFVDTCVSEDPNSPVQILLEGYCKENAGPNEPVYGVEQYNCPTKCIAGVCLKPNESSSNMTPDEDFSKMCRSWAKELGYQYQTTERFGSSSSCEEYAKGDCIGREQTLLKSSYIMPGVEGVNFDCCMWSCQDIEEQANLLHCLSTHPKPISRADCAQRVGCDDDCYCEYFEENLAGPARCDCFRVDIDNDGISDSAYEDPVISFSGYSTPDSGSENLTRSLSEIKRLVDKYYPQLVNVLGKPSDSGSRTIKFFFDPSVDSFSYLPQYDAVVVNDTNPETVVTGLSAAFQGRYFDKIPETWAYGISYAATKEVLGIKDVLLEDYNNDQYPIWGTKIFIDKDILDPTIRTNLATESFTNMDMSSLREINSVLYSISPESKVWGQHAKLVRKINEEVPGFEAWYENQNFLHQKNIIPADMIRAYIFGPSSKQKMIKEGLLQELGYEKVPGEFSRPVEDELTLSWQTYKHEDDPVYTIKYPKGWAVDVHQNPTIGSYEAVTFYVGEDTFASSCSFGITRADDPFDNSFLEGRANKKGVRIIDGYSSKEYINNPSEMEPSTVYQYFPDEKIGGYHLRINYVEKVGQDCLKILEAILSTLDLTPLN